MNLQETITRIFPTGFVKEYNPDKGISFEVHGLPRNSVPQNCEVLASGQFQFSLRQQRSESYLVKTEDFVLFFRIVPAPPDSGYAELALGSGHTP